MPSPTLIAIAGASCSGKTTLALRLESVLDDAVCIVMDWYYRDLSHLTPEERARNNFDHPDALEHELLIEQLGALANGSAIDAPQYDFTQHTRSSQTVRIEPRKYIVLEGLYALHWEAVRGLAAAKIFVDLEHEHCLARRIERDLRERGRSEESVREQYALTVQPMYDALIAPSAQWADLVVRGDAPMDLLTAQSRGLIRGGEKLA